MCQCRLSQTIKKNLKKIKIKIKKVYNPESTPDANSILDYMYEELEKEYAQIAEN